MNVISKHTVHILKASSCYMTWVLASNLKFSYAPILCFIQNIFHGLGGVPSRICSPFSFPLQIFGGCYLQLFVLLSILNSHPLPCCVSIQIRQLLRGRFCVLSDTVWYSHVVTQRIPSLECSQRWRSTYHHMHARHRCLRQLITCMTSRD